MSTCKIGPITFDRGFYYEKGNDYGVMDGKEKFTIKGPIWKINQLRGLVTRGKSKTGESVTIRGSNDNDWGPIWVDAADVNDDTRDNVRLNHKGWYLLRDVDIVHVNEYWAKATLELELLSTHPLQYFEYDHTNPFMVGSLDTPGYALEEEVVLMEDDFNTLDTNKWVDRGTWNMTGSNVGVTGGKLYMEGKRTSGTVWAGTRMLRSKYKFKTPFTVEFDLEFPTTSTYDPGHNIHLALSPINLPLNAWQDVFFNEFSISGSQRYYALGRYDAKKQNVAWGQKYTADTLRKWKWEVDSNGQITISRWNGASYIQEWKGSMGLSSAKELYVYYVFHAHKDLTNVKRAYSDNIKIYTSQLKSLGATVPAPNTGDLLTTPDETTTTTGYYSNPSSRILLQPGASNPNTIYVNSPLGYSSNNTSSSPRLVTGDYERLAPGKFYVQNGDVKLNVLSDGVELYRYYSGAYNLVNKFGFGTIDYLKVLNATPESFKFQANQTEWELRRGEPFVYVKHEYDDIGFTKTTCVFHDDTIHCGLSDGADVSMLTQPYSLHYVPYNLLTQNQCDLESGVAGWVGTGTDGPITQVSPGWYGSYCAKVTTLGSANQGIMQDPGAYCDISDIDDPTGLIIYGGMGLKGSGTVRLSIYERDSSGSILNSSVSSDIVLSPTFTSKPILHTITDPDTDYVSLKVLTTVASVAEIYIDQNFLGPSYNLIYTHWHIAPVDSNRYGLIITKKDPTTIKTNSIPASSMTGLGVYDQMQPPNNCINFKNLALSSLNPVDGRLRLVQR